jgi:hypothetical protein
MSNSIIQTRIDSALLAQLAADAEVLGLTNTSEALRAGIDLLHRKAEQVRLAVSYDHFYDGAAAPLSEATAAIWGRDE